MPCPSCCSSASAKRPERPSTPSPAFCVWRCGFLTSADGAMTDWQNSNRTTARVELQERAQATLVTSREQVAAVVAELAGDQPRHLPGLTGHWSGAGDSPPTLRRPADPRGRPCGRVALRKADDCAVSCPPQLPRLNGGPARCPGRSRVGGIALASALWRGLEGRNRSSTGYRGGAQVLCDASARTALLRTRRRSSTRSAPGASTEGIVACGKPTSAPIPLSGIRVRRGGDLAGLIQEWHQTVGHPRRKALRSCCAHAHIAFAHN